MRFDSFWFTPSFGIVIQWFLKHLAAFDKIYFGWDSIFRSLFKKTTELSVFDNWKVTGNNMTSWLVKIFRSCTFSRSRTWFKYFRIWCYLIVVKNKISNWFLILITDKRWFQILKILRNCTLYAVIPKNIRDIKKIKTFVNKWNFYESSFRGGAFYNGIKFMLCERDNNIKSESVSVS